MTDKENEIVKFIGKVHGVIVKKHSLHSACYLLAFFIYKYCKEVLNAETKIIIGWVNDGTWSGVSSHAWVEYNGKKIDVSLSGTADEKLYPTGDAIVLDRTIESGNVSYSYYYAIPSTAANAYAELKKSANQQTLEFMSSKEREREIMKEIASNDAYINQFFENAPASRRFEAIKTLIERE